MINPYARIRELERELEIAQAGRLKAEDDSRASYAALVVARESESKALTLLAAKSEKFEDWMASLLGRPPIHGGGYEKPSAPAPARRPTQHGAALENEAYLKLAAELEKDLNIDPVN